MIIIYQHKRKSAEIVNTNKYDIVWYDIVINRRLYDARKENGIGGGHLKCL